VILSVAVDPAHQGCGHAGRLLREFAGRMRQAGKSAIHLICREHHIRLYEKFGYRLVGPSASDHGGGRWFDMVKPL